MDEEMMRSNKQAAYGAVYAALAVAFGAFGAHTLEDLITADMLAIFETAVRYQMYHALGLLVIGLAAGHMEHAAGAWRWAGRLIHAGIWIFSGSLYVLSLSGITVLGAITPIGGAAFIAGWVCAAVALWRIR
jgi:uncharacterized membrane protein YgdD (TMEM256/DUF423 family)